MKSGNFSSNSAANAASSGAGGATGCWLAFSHRLALLCIAAGTLLLLVVHQQYVNTCAGCVLEHELNGLPGRILSSRVVLNAIN